MTNTQYFLNFSKPFIQGAKNVFSTMVFTELKTLKPQIKDGKVSLGEISSIMGLTGTIQRDGKIGDFKGMFVLSFPKDTYLKIASAMLMEEYSDYVDEICDVGSEICNIVTGNAKRDLADLGYKIDMSIPSTVTGLAHTIHYPQNTQIVVIPLECSHGPFYMELCYVETYQ
jgi:chemotaxis protein CheX